MVTPALLVGLGEFGRHVLRQTWSLVGGINPDWLTLAAGVCVETPSAAGEDPSESGTAGDPAAPVASFRLDCAEREAGDPLKAALEDGSRGLYDLLRRTMIRRVANAGRQMSVEEKGYAVDRSGVLICIVGSLAEPITGACLCELAAIARRAAVGRAHCCALLALGDEDLDRDEVSSLLKQLEGEAPGQGGRKSKRRSPAEARRKRPPCDRVFLFDAFTEDGRALDWPDDGVAAAAGFLALLLDSGPHEHAQERTHLVGKSGPLQHQLRTGEPALLSSFGLVQYRYSPQAVVGRALPSAAKGLLERCFPQPGPDPTPEPPGDSLMDEFLERRGLDPPHVIARLVDGLIPPEERFARHFGCDEPHCRPPEEILARTDDLCRTFPSEQIPQHLAGLERNRRRILAADREALGTCVDDLVRNAPGGLNEAQGLVAALARRCEIHRAGDRPEPSDPDPDVEPWTDHPDVQHRKAGLAGAAGRRARFRRALRPALLAIGGVYAAALLLAGVLPGLDVLNTGLFLLASAVLLGSAGGAAWWWLDQSVAQATGQLRLLLQTLTAEACRRTERRQGEVYYDELRSACNRQLNHLKRLRNVVSATEQRLAAAAMAAGGSRGGVVLPLPALKVLDGRARQIAEQAAAGAERWLRESDPLHDWRQVEPGELARRAARFCEPVFEELQTLNLEEHIRTHCDAATHRSYGRLLWDAAGPFLQLADSIPELPTERQWWLVSPTGPGSVLAGPITATRSAVVCVPSGDLHAISLLTVVHGIPIRALRRLEEER